MQQRHVEIAARHTLSILRWRVSTNPLNSVELHEALDAIYQDSNANSQLSMDNGSYNAWKAITFNGVWLAYHNFFGQNPILFDIEKFLNNAGDNADWGREAYYTSRN